MWCQSTLITVRISDAYRGPTECSRPTLHLSQVCASYTRRLTPTAAHTSRGFLLAGPDVVDGKGHLKTLAVGFLSFAGYRLNFNVIARARCCYSTHHPWCVRMVSLSSSARRTARIVSIRSDAWCVSRPERRGEDLGEDGRSHVEGG